MSIIEQLLQELIEKLHLGKGKEEAGKDEPKGVEIDLEGSPKEEASESPRQEALEKLAGNMAKKPEGESGIAASEEGPEEEQPTPLKHNHSLREECGPACPMRQVSAK